MLWDGDQNYVWAKNSRDQIEKRIVTLGEIDDEHNDCQILSGIDIDDYIAYPADYIEAGMKTTTNQSDKDIPENVGGDMMDGGMEDGMGTEDGMGMPDNVVYDEDGNMVYTDEDGNVYKFDAEGNMIEGGEELFAEDGEMSDAEGDADAEGMKDEPVPEDEPQQEAEAEQPEEN